MSPTAQARKDARTLLHQVRRQAPADLLERLRTAIAGTDRQAILAAARMVRGSVDMAAMAAKQRADDDSLLGRQTNAPTRADLAAQRVQERIAAIVAAAERKGWQVEHRSGSGSVYIRTARRGHLIRVSDHYIPIWGGEGDQAQERMARTDAGKSLGRSWRREIIV